jgi:hypothetical protein
MVEVKYNTAHHAGGTAAARIAARLRNSGGEGATSTVHHVTSPQRTITNLHPSGGQKMHGADEIHGPLGHEGEGGSE